MSDDATPPARAQLAAAFGTDPDPLAAHTETFATLDVDPFAVFLADTLTTQDPAPATVRAYERLIDQWREFMRTSEFDRHPACPNEQHVRAFVTHCLRDRANQRGTVKTKLRRLAGIVRAWQTDPVFPHSEYNPFKRVLSTTDLDREPIKQPPRIPISELQDIIADVTHIRDRIVLCLQLKLGLRASELSNLRLSDIRLDAPVVQAAYPTLGNHPALAERHNAVYIATRSEREGNKSFRPRVLPLDTELQQLLRQYLVVRPDADTEAVVLTTSTHNRLGQEAIARIWRTTFQSRYPETDTHRAVTSHFGRHRFTTYWRVEQDLPRPQVQYLRGDTPGTDPLVDNDAIDAYIHTYYADIEPAMRTRHFELL